MKLAQYRTPNGTVIHLTYTEAEPDSPDSSYLRVSEPLEVQFVPRPVREVQPIELAQLDVIEERTKAEYANKMNVITRRRSELLAIDYNPIADSKADPVDALTDTEELL